jgi:hypothetical protein
MTESRWRGYEPCTRLEHVKRIPADHRNRLLSKEEVDTRLDVLGD